MYIVKKSKTIYVPSNVIPKIYHRNFPYEIRKKKVRKNIDPNKEIVHPTLSNFLRLGLEYTFYCGDGLKNVKIIKQRPKGVAIVIYHDSGSANKAILDFCSKYDCNNISFVLFHTSPQSKKYIKDLRKLFDQNKDLDIYIIYTIKKLYFPEIKTRYRRPAKLEDIICDESKRYLRLNGSAIERIYHCK